MKKIKQRLVAGGLAMAMSLGLTLDLSLTASAETIFYDDYAQFDTGHQVDSWAVGYVSKVINKYFMPEIFYKDLRLEVTREQYATLLVLIFEENVGMKVGYPSFWKFTDCDSDYVKKAVNLGIVAGKTETTFDPEGLVTREEAAVMLATLLKEMDRILVTGTLNVEQILNHPRVSDELKMYLYQMLYMIQMGIETEEYAEFIVYSNLPFFLTGIYAKMLEESQQVYDDDAEISDWARESVYIAYEMEVMAGVGGNNFQPQGNIDGQSALVLAVQLLGY